MCDEFFPVRDLTAEYLRTDHRAQRRAKPLSSTSTTNGDGERSPPGCLQRQSHPQIVATAPRGNRQVSNDPSSQITGFPCCATRAFLGLVCADRCFPADISLPSTYGSRLRRGILHKLGTRGNIGSREWCTLLYATPGTSKSIL